MTDDRRDPRPTPAPDDRLEERLLRLAGRRAEIPPPVMERLRAAARAEWRSTLRRRRRRRSWRAAALLAAAALVALAVGLLWRARPAAPPAPAAVVATVRSLSGDGAHLAAGGRSGATPALALTIAQPLTAGSEVVTTGGRTALELVGGTTLRLDHGTRLRLASAAALELTAGAVYVDTGAGEARGRVLAIATPLGRLRDIGTRFEVRLEGPELRVRVRSGTVALERGPRTAEVPAGQELTTAARGDERRRTIPVWGDEWDWVLAAAPGFALEGSSLESFLAWVTAETGWEVRFADPTLAAGAGRVVLHGSIAGLRADRAVDVVLPSCGLDGTFSSGALLVARRP